MNKMITLIRLRKKVPENEKKKTGCFHFSKKKQILFFLEISVFFGSVYFF